MPRGSKKRTRPKIVPDSTERIVSTQVGLEQQVCFNLQHFYQNHKKFSYHDRKPVYFCKLLERLKNLSTMTRKDLMGSRSKSIRFNPIDFNRKDVSEDSFNLMSEDADDNAFEFSVSANEHGRVHGFFIGNIFYIVWLDPDHKLCPNA